jgi:hypothetical protein
LDIPFFKEGVAFTSTDTHYSVKNSLSDELCNIIKSGGLTIHLVEAFYRTCGNFSPIHTDSMGQPDIGKLNFVFDSANSKMVWYTPKNGMFPIAKITKIGTKYNTYNTNQVDILESVHLTGPVIIQAGVPHNIVDVTGPRTAVSVILFKDGRIAKMGEIVEVFNKYVIN